MMKKITFYLLLGLLGLIAQEAFAVPAVPWPVDKEQPDGTKITVYLKGDEKVHWMESLDGYTLMYDADKYVVYAEKDAKGDMIPSRVKYQDNSLRSSSSSSANAFKGKVGKGVRYSKSQVELLMQIWKVEDNAIQKAPVEGERKALCVLMGFTNKPFTKSVSDIENLMNQVGYSANNARGSVKDFYKENSYGKLDLTVTVVGPYTAPNTTMYYATNEKEFAKIAAEAADADVDYTEFANAADQLETFHIIFAGYGDEAIQNGQQIWSHKWQLVTPIYLDGVRIYVYSCSPELSGTSGNTLTHIGVVCHELCHVFGAPDYYDANSSTGGSYNGTGDWDLMASGSWNGGGITPAHINMFQKIEYGWVTPIELTEYTEVTDMLNSAENPVAYTIPITASGEKYVLENRQRKLFDIAVPGNGLLIYHVAENALSGYVNGTHPQKVYPVVSNRSTAYPTAGSANYGVISSANAPFGGNSGVTSFTDETTPKTFSWANPESGIGKPLTGINMADGKISFVFMAGAGTLDPVEDLDQSVTGGSVTLSWTAPDNEDVTGYKVYRDNILQYTISNKTTVTYTQNNVSNGTYNYCVSAVYNLLESDKECIGVNVTDGSDDACLPISNLQASTTPDKVTLSWDAPFSGGWMSIAGAVDSGYSFNNSQTYFAGTLWTKEDLKGLNGFELTKIKFVPYESGGSYKLKVYTDEGGNNFTEMYSQDINQALSYDINYDEVTLTTPQIVDASKGLLVGIEFYTTGGTGNTSLVVDAGPVVSNKNWYYDSDNGWVSFDGEFKGNFCFQAYLDGEGSSPVIPDPSLTAKKEQLTQPIFASNSGIKGKSVIKSKIAQIENFASLRSDNSAPQPAPSPLARYDIYRDGVKIGQSPTTSYEDATVASGTTYTYCVSAVYENDCVSEEVCKEVTTDEVINTFNPIQNLYLSSKQNGISVKWEAPFSEGLIGHCSQNIASANTGGAMDMSIAARFDKEDLAKANGLQLTKVSYGVLNNTAINVSPSTVDFTIQIWRGGTASAPAELIHEQPVPSEESYFTAGWHEIELTTPIDIDVYSNLWIGLGVHKKVSTSVYPIAYDGGPTVSGKGDMFYVNGAWTTGSSSIQDFNGNWSLTGYVEAPDGSGAPIILSPIAKSSVASSSFNPASVAELSSMGTSKSSSPAYLDAPTGYKILRNGTDLVALPATQLDYLDGTVSEETYEYCVIAVYAGGESEKVCDQVTFETINMNNPVENLAVFAAGSDVNISWEEPYSEGRIGYSGEIDNAYGGGNDFMMAVRFTKEELEKMGNFQLSKVVFGVHPNASAGVNPTNVSYTIKVWGGGNGKAPETLLYEQDVPDFQGGWNEVGLTTPVPIDIFDDFWIGLHAVKKTGTSYPATVDAGPVVAGKGDFIYADGQWSSFGNNKNWTIQGVVERADGSGSPQLLNRPENSKIADGNVKFDTSSIGGLTIPDSGYKAPSFVGAPTGYKITRDGTDLITVNSDVFSHKDEGLTPDTYEYCVTAVYSDGNSDPKCAETTVYPEVTTYNPVQNLAVISTEADKAVIRWDAPFSGGLIGHCAQGINGANTGGATDMSIAARFDRDDLLIANGLQLTKVSYGILNNSQINVSPSTVDFTIQIWVGGTNSTPGSLIHEQPVPSEASYYAAGWHEIELTSPVNIDINNNLWIGLGVHKKVTGNIYPIAYDAGPVVTGKGDMFYVNGGWTTGSAALSDFNANWSLMGYVEAPDGSGAPVILSPIDQSSVANSSFDPASVAELVSVDTTDETSPAYLEAISSYKIYKDGTELATLLPTQLSYEDDNLQPGTYEYCVEAVYPTGTSDQECGSITIGDAADPYLPVINLASNVEGKDVTLTWDEPEFSKTISYSTLGDGETPKKIGTGSAADFDIAARWPVGDLSGVDGRELTQIRFVPLIPECTYSVRVWVGGDASAPGVMVVDQVVSSPTLDAWNEIELDNPVFVNSSQELWIGVRCNTTAGYPAAMDNQTMVEGKGNMMNLGGWSTANKLGSTLTGNWLIEGVVSVPDAGSTPMPLQAIEDVSGRKAEGELVAVVSEIPVVNNKPLQSPEFAPAIQEYQILRDGVEAGTSTTTTFTETVADWGNYNYCVVVNYGSKQSAEVCIDVDVENTACRPVTNLVADVTDNVVTLNWELGTAPKAIFHEGFESGIPATWQNVDDDGDGYMWYDLYASSGQGFDVYEGEGFVTSASYQGGALTPDNWLITPAIPLTTGNTLSYAISAQDADFPAEHYGVYISTTDTDLSSFTLLFEEDMTASPGQPVSGPVSEGMFRSSGPQYVQGTWYVRTVDLSAYEGETVYLAFRHHDCTDEFRLNLDDVNVFEPAVNLYNIYKDGVLLAEDISATTYDDIVDGTADYEYCVVATAPDCTSAPICITVNYESPCAEVTNLLADMNDKEVTLSWEFDKSWGNTVIFHEGFESGIPSTWLNLDEDGDGHMWYDLYASSGAGFDVYEGEGFVTSASYQSGALTPDNWLITPAIALTADNTLSYAISAQDAAYPAEHYGVYISTTDTDLSSFTLLFEEDMTASPGQPVSGPVSEGMFRSSGPQYVQGTWYVRTVDLSAYEGETVYLAFRHHDCTDEFRLNLDDVNVLEPVKPVFNVYQDGALVADHITDKSFTVEVPADGDYEFCVTSVTSFCESDPVCIDVTYKSCEKVINLVADLTDNVVTLNWDNGKSGKKLFFEGFESGFPVGWQLKDEDGDGNDWLLNDPNIINITASAHTGESCIVSESYRNWAGGAGGDVFTPDNWLITPAITLTDGNELDYWVAAQDADYPADHYGVYISTSGTDIIDFTLLMEETMTGSAPAGIISPLKEFGERIASEKAESRKYSSASTDGPQRAVGTWYNRTIDLSAYAGQTVYIAFRHFDCSDEFVLKLDDIAITEVIPNYYDVYRGGELLASDLSATTYTETLDESGDYEYCIVAKAGTCTSEEACITVTYDSPCVEVTNLLAAMNDNTVTLSWDFDKDLGVNTIFSEDFETGAVGWKAADKDQDGLAWGLGSSEGNTYAMSESFWLIFPLTPDNWMISPAIDLTEDNTLKYYISSENEYPAEHYGVYIGTKDPLTYADLDDYVLLYEETMQAGTAPSGVASKADYAANPERTMGSWRERTVDLSAYAGQKVYIAFRHFDCTDQLALYLDDISVTEPKKAEFNVYQDGTLIASAITEKTLDVVLPAYNEHEFCVTSVTSFCESEQVCVDVDFGADVIEGILVAMVDDKEQVHISWTGTADQFHLHKDNAHIHSTPTNSHIDSNVAYGQRYLYTVYGETQYGMSKGVSAEITIRAPFVILTHPAGTTVCEGEDYKLSIDVIGDDVLYQWYRNDVAITGATASELSITNASVSDVGAYKVVMVNSKGSYTLTSNVANIQLTRDVSGFSIAGIPTSVYTGETYVLQLNLKSGITMDDVDEVKWTFSNDLATIEPVSGSDNSVNLIIGETAGSGILTVEVSNSCGTYTYEETISFIMTGIDNVLAQIQLYPNPTSEVLYISSELSDITAIIVSDVNGREIFMNKDAESLGRKQIIATTHWAKGMYFVRIVTNDGETVHKVIKK